MGIDKAPLSANLLAALILVVLGQLRELGLLQMTGKAVLEATGAKKSRVYELVASLRKCLDVLEAPVGRPKTPPAAPGSKRAATLAQLSIDLLAYMYEHPGAVEKRAPSKSKSCYSPGFRGFVVRQCIDNPELDTGEIAGALSLPAPTVRGWLRATKEAVAQATTPDASTGAATGAPFEPAALFGTINNVHIQTILSEWQSWCGPTFSGFCAHLAIHHGLPVGRSMVALILERAGERSPAKRRGRSPDEKAMRNAFVSFFPGAVWTADGCQLSVEVEGQRFTFNLELMVDTHSGAYIGVDVRDHEDAAALISSFEEGVATTGNPSLALLVDNKPSNHAAAVHEAVDEKETLLIPATVARPQNKAHAEGAFGLFSQCAPPIQLDTGTAKECARQLLELCVRTFFNAMNMRPRASHKGRSRIDLYHEKQPKAEEIEQAKAELEARLQKQLAARETRRARQDPAKRAYLDEALARLGLSDPSGQVQATIARYDLDDITTGVAIFGTKQRDKKLPDGVDVRYLWGIVKNVAREREGMAIAMVLWDERIKARDFVFAPLIAKRNERMDTDLDTRLRGFVDEALTAKRQIERYFWLDAVADVVLEYPTERRRSVFEGVAGQIHTAYRQPHEHRDGAALVIARKVLPLL